jgi:hypothetical protein
MANVNYTEVLEDSGKRLMNRITDDSGTDLEQADVSSIAYTVYDAADLSSSTASGSLTVSTVIYDTLQTDSAWDTDSTGYNFGWSAPSSIFSKGGILNKVEIAFTPASGEAFKLIWFVRVRSISAS